MKGKYKPNVQLETWQKKTKNCVIAFYNSTFQNNDSTRKYCFLKLLSMNNNLFIIFYEQHKNKLCIIQNRFG